MGLRGTTEDQKPAAAKKAAAPKPNDLPKADGWLNNLTVHDKYGNPHRLPKGLALTVDNNVMASLVKAEAARLKAWEDAGEVGEYQPLQITITANVYVPSTKPQAPIEF